MKLLMISILLILSSNAHSTDAVEREMERRAQYLITLNHPYTGPNCWNSSMFVYGVVENFRFLDLEEFEYYLRKYCRKLKKDEPLTWGTLIVAREYDDSDFINDILHSFVYFSKDKAFGKDSREPIDKPHFDPFKTAFAFAKFKTFFYEIPNNFSGKLATPYDCDFSEMPIMPDDVKAIMETFHQINTETLPLTVELYHNLVSQADGVDVKGKEKYYSRRLMFSVREQIRHYGIALNLINPEDYRP